VVRAITLSKDLFGCQFFLIGDKKIDGGHFSFFDSCGEIIG
jgi:hypothetical protein